MSVITKFEDFSIKEELDKFKPVDDIRILKYEEGVESTLHIDRSEFNSKSTHRFLIYLSDFEGGDLIINDYKIKPSKGKMVIFNLKEYHKSPKVTNGTKYIITGELETK